MTSGVSRPFSRHSAPTIAVAGAGYIAVVHAFAAQAAGIRVKAVASLGGSSARHLAGQLDARRTTIDLLPAGADILVVASPPESHMDLALQGAERGAVVLVEKPLATTLAEADRIVSAVEAGATIRCAENLLHAPVIATMRQMLPSLGKIDHLSLRTMQPSPDWGHFARPLRHGGVVFDLGPHAVALAMEFAREPVVSVSARLTSSRSDDADDDAEIEFRFASGLTASLEVSWCSEQTVWDAQLSSPTGVLRLELLPEVGLEHNGEPVGLERHHADVEPTLEQFGYLGQIIDMGELARGSASHAGQSVQQARDVLEVICAVYASAGDSGRSVGLPFAGDRNVSPLELWRGASNNH